MAAEGPSAPAPRGELHGGNRIATARRLGCRVDQLLDASASLASPLGHKYSSAYCAPELAKIIAAHVGKDWPPENEAVLPKAHPSFDIFSVGVILYELCTGKQLFPHVLDDLEQQVDQC